MEKVNVCVFNIGKFMQAFYDKDGFGYEFSMLRKAISKSIPEESTQMVRRVYLDYKKPNIIFVLNGELTQEDIESLQRLKEHGAYLIYVWTRYELYNNNFGVIRLCDAVIGQIPDCNKEFYCEKFGKPYYYSYIPELYYNDSIPKSKYKHELCFCNVDLDKADDVLQGLIFGNMNDFNYEMVVTYKEKDADFRLNYGDYRRQLSMYKYVLLPGHDYGDWVTKDFVEAVNADCIPMLSPYYDQANHFQAGEYRVFSNSDIGEIMSNATYVSKVVDLHIMQERIAQGQLKFVRLIKKLVKGSELI